MALDGLSNQNVGIYRSKDPSKTTDHLTARSKEKAEMVNTEESTFVEKVNPDGKRHENNEYDGFEDENEDENELAEQEEETEEENAETSATTELTVYDDNETSVELEYKVEFNIKTQMVEIKDAKNNEMIETAHPEELLKVFTKAKSLSGMFCDRKI